MYEVLLEMNTLHIYPPPLRFTFTTTKFKLKLLLPHNPGHLG